MNILHLTIKKEFFDMIARGEKKEEYRAMKHHWCARLETGRFHIGSARFKKFDIVRFRAGYHKDSPTLDVECNGIRFGVAKPEWSGGLFDWCYVISLGEILNEEARPEG